jgi:putative flippase GtrA
VALVKFFVVAAVGFLLNAIVMQAGIDYLSLHYLVAQVAATASVVLWNFYGNLVWSFR